MREESALAFLSWLDGGDDSGADSCEMRLTHILGDARVDGTAKANSAARQVVDEESEPRIDFAQDLLRHLEILADTGGVFAAESRVGAVMRVREALPIRLPETGVAYCGSNGPDDVGRVQYGRARHPVALLVAAVLLIGAVLVPVVHQFVAAVSINRDAVVAAAGADAARRVGDAWVAVKIGDHIKAGQTVTSGRERLTLRLNDDSVVRMAESTYGTLSLHSKDPSIQVGDGRVYVEVNSSGAVNVLVDGIVIAGHGPGSSYSVDAKGIVTVTEGGAEATDANGKKTAIPEGKRFANGDVSSASRSGDDSEWLEWNQAGGRNPRS